MLPLQRLQKLLALPFLCKNPAVFAGKNPRILFMAKRQKAREAVLHRFRSRTSDFFKNTF